MSTVATTTTTFPHLRAAIMEWLVAHQAELSGFSVRCLDRPGLGPILWFQMDIGEHHEVKRFGPGDEIAEDTSHAAPVVCDEMLAAVKRAAKLAQGARE